jgi:ubiquinone/menaquinone biosynthesis C-methylase UbiE
MNLSSIFSDQDRKPSGWFGSIVMPIVFDRGNAFLNRLVHTLMQVQPDDRVLEIGCGTGTLTKMMAKTIETGIIEGIDFSSTVTHSLEKPPGKWSMIGPRICRSVQSEAVDMTAAKGGFRSWIKTTECNPWFSI